MNIPASELPALHAAIAALCPIVGVDANGNITFDPKSPPTTQQQAAAEQVVSGWDSEPIYECYLWQLQAVMTEDQWTAVGTTVAAMNNRTLTAFFTHPGNLLPSNSTTLLAIAQAIGLTGAQATGLVKDAMAIIIP